MDAVIKPAYEVCSEGSPDLILRVNKDGHLDIEVLVSGDVITLDHLGVIAFVDALERLGVYNC